MSHIDSGGDPNSLKAGRELADVSLPSLWHHAAYLVITCVIVWFAMMGMFKLFMGRLADRDPQVSALARQPGEAVPEPRLLTNEPLNLQQFNTTVQDRLHGYGYVDQAAGTVHIPIEKAKELLLQRGLPVRGQTAPTPPAAAAPRTDGH